MLTITDFNGVDLVELPPATIPVVAVPVTGGRATVQCLAICTGTLPVCFVTGTVLWGDGSLPVVYNGTTAGTLTIDTFRSFQPGDYVVTVEAHDYSTPVWNTVNVNFSFHVQSQNAAPVVTPLIYGPILPKDAGYPNEEQWNWDRGEDIEILASSLKMLLTTNKGERVMLPEYGTNLTMILFEFQGQGIESMVQQEVNDAITQWEPRVTLQFLEVQKVGEREVAVNATFISKLNQQPFFVPMVFSK